MFRSLSKGLFTTMAALSFAALPLSSAAFAQVGSVDPNDAIDADLKTAQEQPAQTKRDLSRIVDDVPQESDIQAELTTPVAKEAVQEGTNSARSAQESQNSEETVTDSAATQTAVEDDTTYQKDDLIGAAEGVFGKGAKGLAGIIEKILSKQGRPNAYIAGREASAALVVGFRYGSGTLSHKIEGDRKAYWTGPSVGFDAGGNAGNTFVLVYNLFDTEDLYKRFAAGEGAAYFVGGFHASYLRKGNIVLIPIRLGVGLRLGANVGYMKITKKKNWIPF